MRIIKYGNRKLYSREQSKYITLADVVVAVKRSEHVYAATKQGEDVTVSVLAQALATEIAAGASCKEELLVQAIKNLDKDVPASQTHTTAPATPTTPAD